MSQPIVKYSGDVVTCYPGSNQTDDGKLNMEYNMARIVTRLSSKNFCIVKPSFNIETLTNTETGLPQLRILKGQASINGMDIIISDSIIIDPPEKAGKYHLAFKLARDSSWNVLGDLVYGSKTTFEGLYLTYYEEKPDPLDDDDMLYLGEINWDGTSFGDIIEDEDKYGRIWAEDILCKIKDPKHPNISRLILQDWIYKVPDWYVSKEGDVEYGAIEFLPGRDGIQSYGIKIQAEDDSTSRIRLKAPKTQEGDSRSLLLEANNSGVKAQFLDTEITCYKDNESDLYWNTNSGIYINSKEDINVHGNWSVSLSTLVKDDKTKKNTLILLENNLKYISDLNNDIKYQVSYPSANTIEQTIGKTIYKYDSSVNTLDVLNTNTDYYSIHPKVNLYEARIINTLYIGNEDIYGNENSYLKKTLWRLGDYIDRNSYTEFYPLKLTMVNSSYKYGVNHGTVTLRNSDDTIHTKLYDSGKIELLNGQNNPGINFYDGNTSYDSAIYKILGQKKLQVTGALGASSNIFSDGTVIGDKGLTTQNGIITFIIGSSTSATITKDSNSGALRTSSDLYIGNTANANLYTNNINIKGTITQGSSEQFKVDAQGNLNTSGTITGSKVYNAVYNDYAEVFRKDKNEEINPGDIVCIREDGLVHKVSTTEDLNSVIGVCSNTEGVLLGGLDIPEEEQVIVGLVGKLWVNCKDPIIKPGMMVKVTNYNEVKHTYNKADKFGIAMKVEQDKILIVFNG